MTEQPRDNSESPFPIAVIAVLMIVILSVVGSGWWLWSRLHQQVAENLIVGDIFPPTVAEFRPEPTTLAPGLHVLGRMPYGVAYAIEGSEGWALIDTGLEADAAGVVEQIRELGLELQSLRAILLTHAHGDHTFGARRLRELTGAKVYAGAGDAGVLRAGEPREAFFSTYSMDQVPLHATPIDVELQDGDTVELGDTTITAVATPGHTPGSMCYVRTRGGSRVLFGGDTISSIQDDLGTYAVMLPPRFRGDAGSYLASLRRLRELPAPELVCPGHPNESRTRHGPQVTNDQWFALLDRGIRDTEEVVRRYEADGADFLDGEPKQILDGLYYLGDRSSGSIRVRPTYAWHTKLGVVLFDAPGDEDSGDEDSGDEDSGDEDLAYFARHALEKLGLAEPKIAAVLMTSHDSSSTSGLAELVRRTSCAVVAPTELADRLRKQLPEDARLVAPDDWAQSIGVTMETVMTSDAGSPSASYRFRLGERRVLITGAVPISLSPSATTRLRANLGSRLMDASAVLATLTALRDPPPDVWLPAEASFGQNANLYGEQWHAIIEGNARLVRPFQ